MSFTSLLPRVTEESYSTVGGVGIAAAGSAVGIGALGLTAIGTIGGLAVYGVSKAIH